MALARSCVTVTVTESRRCRANHSGSRPRVHCGSRCAATAAAGAARGLPAGGAQLKDPGPGRGGGDGRAAAWRHPGISYLARAGEPLADGYSPEPGRPEPDRESVTHRASGWKAPTRSPPAALEADRDILVARYRTEPVTSHCDRDCSQCQPR